MSDSLLDIWNMKKRAKRDSRRHSERVKKAIKENLKDLVSHSSIISSDGKKKVKIPLKQLDTYRFKHGKNKNKEGVGHSNHGNKPGDAIAHDGTGTGGKGSGGYPSEEEGEEIYEEVELEEIINLMLEDLELPWLEEKDNATEIETENIIFDDISNVGSISNVDKKHTIMENMKRNAKTGKAQLKDIQQGDLRYKVWDTETERHSNAAVYCLMDRSGSMNEDKRYIAKSIFFYITHFCKAKYDYVDLIFIAHDTKASVVPEENFFKISNSGGTLCSSAFKLALEHIEANHPSNKWNNFVFEFSDGDNHPNDNKVCVDLINKLLQVCSAVGYGEINTDSLFDYGRSIFNWSTLHQELEKEIDHPRFLTASIEHKEDIYKSLKEFLGIKKEK